MKEVNYFKIIHKYIPPDSITYCFYIPHAVLVTAKALKIGEKLGLSEEQLRFIEEASMLHDIGIIKTKDEEMDCRGNKPYISHVLEGQKILEAEGLPKHARVAKNHIGIGITKEEIIRQGLPFPHEDIKAESIEERIISYADLFYSKVAKGIWQERSFEEVRKNIGKFGQRQLEILDKWHEEFGSLGINQM